MSARGAVVSWGDAHACDVAGCKAGAKHRFRSYRTGEIIGAACLEHKDAVIVLCLESEMEFLRAVYSLVATLAGPVPIVYGMPKAERGQA